MNKENIKSIVGIMLNTVFKRTKEQMNITMNATDKVKAQLAEAGFDSNYGARPLRRAIQTKVEDAMAEEILDGRIKAGNKVTLKVKDGEIIFSVNE